MITSSELEEQTTWRFFHRKLAGKITHHSKSFNDGKGIWCYYVIIPESSIPEHFQPLWLEPRLVKLSDESRGFVTYNYEDLPPAKVDWHGGVTFYAKHGELPGHRSIELGCDFNHLFDYEAGLSYNLETVAIKALKTLNQIANLYNLS